MRGDKLTFPQLGQFVSWLIEVRTWRSRGNLESGGGGKEKGRQGGREGGREEGRRKGRKEGGKE